MLVAVSGAEGGAGGGAYLLWVEHFDDLRYRSLVERRDDVAAGGEELELERLRDRDTGKAPHTDCRAQLITAPI